LSKAIQIYRECARQGNAMAKQFLQKLAQQGVLPAETKKENQFVQTRDASVKRYFNFDSISPF
jgi:hypothetical protein